MSYNIIQLLFSEVPPLMARERYLLGAGEDTIHSDVIELKTAKDKRANWWFYHRNHLIFGIIIAAILFSLVYSIASKVEPDYSIALITSYQLPEDVLAAMEAHIAPYADDRNGDGRVVVQMNNYVFGDVASSNDYQAQQASYARFAGDASLGSCVIYMHDPAGFSSLEGDFPGFFQYNDGSPMPDTAHDYENAMRPWSDFAGLADFASSTSLEKWTPEVLEELCGKLRVSVRTTVDSNLGSSDKLMAYYEDSIALLDRLEQGVPLDTAPGET